MKKLINDPANAVAEMVAGLVATQPGLTRIAGRSVVLRADLPAPEHRKVAIISGGGSGHEPAHAGYVGAGMLTAAAGATPPPGCATNTRGPGPRRPP